MATGKINNTGNISGRINSATKNASASISITGSGSADHNRLFNRDSTNQHPISAITGLQEILDNKLDASTALPLIEEATKYKAKGLYFDAKKELNKKSYWYLTSEIDPITKQGTKESIISGPYDLGAGGGGSSGGTSLTTITLGIAVDPNTGKQLWPYNVSVGSKCEIGVNWTSTRDNEPTGRGTLYVYVAGKLVETKTAAQGIVKFDLTDYIISGANKVEIRVVDAYSSSKNFIDTINGIVLKLASNFEDDISYTNDVIFTYIPTGSISKKVYFILDGIQYGVPDTVETTAEQCTKIFPASAFSHGSHTLQVYFTCEIDGEEVRSNELYYDIIYYQVGNNTPIIASTFISPAEEEQYVSFNIKYRIYTPNAVLSAVELYKDGVKEKELTVDTTNQIWECRFDIVGNHTLEIRTGTVSKYFNIHIYESTIHVEPVMQSLALALNSSGRSNAEPLDIRSAWNYESATNTVLGKLSGFNWAANGWVQDDNGNTVLRVSGDARVTIEYKPFEADFTATGKTFEFEIATSDVKNYEARIIECLDGSDTITSTQTYVGEDTRTKKFIVDSVDDNLFIEKVLQKKGTYTFICDGTNWNLNGNVYSLVELETVFGIKVSEVDLDSSISEPSHYLNGDRIIIYYTVSGKGFYITPQLAKLQSQQSSLSTQYKENDKVRLAFVVEKRTEGTATFKTKLIYMYINGILSGISRYPDSDSFRQNPASFIKIGSNDATVDIYNLRIYDNNLTRKQIVNNWIADMPDPITKARYYKHNDNYDDVGNISVEKIAALGNLPYMIVDTPVLPTYKKDRKYATVTYTNPADESLSFTAEDARMDVQGTSSQYYYKKNFKIKYEGGFEDLNGNWSEHYKLRGDKSKKEKTFTYKADVASSEGANNVELVRYFEDSKNWYSPAELLPDEDIPGSTDSKLRIRVGIDGLPIVMFHNDGNTTSFYGKMNFNNDKNNERTYGFQDGDECWEFLHNTSDLVLFKTDDLANWQDSFESRYPETAGSDAHAYGTLPGERSKLQEVLTWVVSTRRLDTDSEDIKARKLAKFKAEFENYFDLNSSLFYYLYTELFLLVDSRAKNAMLTYLKSRQTGDGGDKWFWFPYDMDTGLGINNEGLLVYDYDKEDTDTQEGAYIFNGQDSVFWMNLRDAYKTELKDLYNVLRTSSSDRIAWSFDSIEKYYSDHQEVWSETIFNEDAYAKYLEPYILNQDATYLGMAQGSKAEQRRWWLANRFKYIDSKYRTGDASGKTIMLRAYQRSNFEITPYINCYSTAVFDQATEGLTVTNKAMKGEATTLVPPAGWNPANRDSVVILYSADILQDIGDISGFKPGYADFSQATKLQRLKIGNADPTYENTNLRGINIGANHLLTYLDARNCKNLGSGDGAEVTPTIDLQQCTSIEEVYMENTQIKGCSFPIGGNLKVVHLPETLTALTIRNHTNLTDFKLAGTEFLSSLWLEDIPAEALDVYSYVMNMPIGSHIRLIGIEVKVDSEVALENFYDRLDKLKGLDAKGDDTEKAQITGKIYIDEISYQLYTELSKKYQIDIIAKEIICTVNFYNEGILFDSQGIIQGNSAVLPAIPEKASTQEFYYTFNSWDKSFENVQTDLDINAIFDQHIQQYTVTFDTGSTLISVTPEAETVDYGSLISIPTLGNIPENVTFLGWFKENGTDWDFAEDRIYANIILYAHWLDAGVPSVKLARQNYNTFNYTCEDNLGITGWAVSKNNTETPAAWQSVKSVTPFIGSYKITSTGEYYFWVKDEQDNNSFAKIIAWPITVTKAPGTTYAIAENENILSDFALNNTTARLHVKLDEHYKNLAIKVNDKAVSNDTDILINQNTLIDLAADPKSYPVHFDMMGKDLENQEPDQNIVYLNKIEQPADHYISGEYIEGWYTSSTFESKWDFDTNTVDGEITLYAKWAPYRKPTKITLNIDEDNTEITFNYYLMQSSSIQVNWDNKQSAADKITNDDAIDPILGAKSHIYEKSGIYTVEIQTLTGSYTLGNHYTTPAIKPAKYVTTVEFAWDMVKTRQYAFLGAINLTEIMLPSVMTQVETGAFAGCTGLKTVTLSRNLVRIGDQAFQGCTNLQGDLILPSKITSLGANAFDGCSKLNSVTISAKLDKIPKYCFRNCSSLKSVDLANITAIDDQAFNYCSSLEKIVFKPELKTFGTNCFMGCNLLKIAGNDDSCDVKFSWADKIPNNAFYGMSITEITIPTSVKELGNYAFANMTSLSNIILPIKLEKIGNNAFDGSAITKLVIPFNVLDIGVNAFARSKLRKIKINAISSETKVDLPEDSWFLNCSSNLVAYIDSTIVGDASYTAFGSFWDNYDLDNKIMHQSSDDWID